MPTYEYACRDCGEHLEVVQSFKDDPLTLCPACEGRLRKVFSAAPIVFKGSGWHSKDYGPSGAKSGKADASPSTDSSSGKAASEESARDSSGGTGSGDASSSGTGDEARSA